MSEIHQTFFAVRQTLEKAYLTVRNPTGAALERQKELYDRRVHGDEYQVGDLVWLHNPVIPKGAKRKLYTVHGLGLLKL